MIDLLMIAASLFAAPAGVAAAEPKARTEQAVLSLRESWRERARLQDRHAGELLVAFQTAAALYKEGASGDTQADTAMVDAVAAVARAYHAARAKADIAGRFASFLEDAPSAAEAQAWIAAEGGRVAAIDDQTRELQQGLMLLVGSGAGPGGMSEQWSAVLAAEGWRAGMAGELRLIGRALTVHYARVPPSVPAPADPQTGPVSQVALVDGI